MQRNYEEQAQRHARRDAIIKAVFQQLVYHENYSYECAYIFLGDIWGLGRSKLVQIVNAKDEPTRELIIRTYQRRTPVSEKELAARQRFANVSAEVKRRMEAGDTRRRGIIFKEVYAERKAVDSKNIESASKASRKHPEGKC